jgi:hypothetical protein
VYTVSRLASPAAPAARAAASGPAPVPAPGRDRPRLSLLASSLRVVAPSPAPLIYTAPCVMFLMPADTLRGQVGWGWALEIESFWAL